MKSKTENTDSSLYLKEAHLSGYKSIKDVKIDFKNGLNIIIGKNAAGKTNFLTFLNSSLINSYGKLFGFSANLIFTNGREVSILQENIIENRGFENIKGFEAGNINTTIRIDGKEVEKDKSEHIDAQLLKVEVSFNSTLIYHGIPIKYLIADVPFSFEIPKNEVPASLFSFISEKNNPFLINSIIIQIIITFLDGYNSNEAEISNLLKNVIREIIDMIKPPLIKYTPIEDFRINNSFNIFTDKEKFTVNNFFFEYKIEGNWHPFSNLSDGTKRLFFIISEIAFLGNVKFSESGFVIGLNEVNKIILLEEPELGIHPHQLHNLMTFLKEMSRDRQIIISTHSPQVLNILEKDELDRIIIASSKGKEGTKMRHLNEEEILKAQKYMEEDFLSDYWIYSDLEKE